MGFPDELLFFMLIVKSSKQSFFDLPRDDGDEDSLLYGLFLKGTVELTLDLLALGCTLLLFIDGAATVRVVPLAAAAAAAIARLAFLCRIPQALQSDLGPLGPLLQRGVLVVLQSEQTLIIGTLFMLFDELLLQLIMSAPNCDDGCCSFCSSNLCDDNFIEIGLSSLLVELLDV